MTKKPAISIIMNCHNGERFLEKALKSVLSQSFKNWELIFGTIDQLIKVKKYLKVLKIKDLNIITHKKVSLYESRNARVKKLKEIYCIS